MRVRLVTVTIKAMDPQYLTPEGRQEIEQELARLHEARTESEHRLGDSLVLAGDAGDVGEYLDEQREQELLDRRIELLEERLATALVSAPAETPREGAVIGTAADVEDLDTGVQSHFELVSSAESNPARGRLSVESPVGRAIVGHRPGDTVEVLTPKGRRHLKVLSVQRQ